MSLVSDIKLIRTDTSLDLSQKAEKGILQFPHQALHVPLRCITVLQSLRVSL
jgi:hypothetical protein